MVETAENYIPRQYNYNLETGTVGTDDENMANVLYNINRLEMKSGFNSANEAELGKALGETFSLLVDIKVHLNRFSKAFGDKLNAETLQTVSESFDKSSKLIRQMAEVETDPELICQALNRTYKEALATVPALLVLDAQAVGRA